LQQDFANESMPASAGIARLKQILDRMDLRFNLVLVVPLNVLLLWNIQQALSLDKWKSAYDQRVRKWFNSLGDWEALASFGVLRFNQPEWVFPTVVPDHFFIKATTLGHPLIAPQKRVNNEIDIEQKAAVMLVTGSNMAGKSTYLRSIGINIILAMAGAPVCAKTFECSAVQLMSSMRIADNLEESTSTFYAELKKLKTIIEKVNEKSPVFILLDEILRGTNSLDRHTGSKALIKQLIAKEAAAVLATHDVDLAALQSEYPSHIFNYHFDVQVNGEELYFDYQLKPGVCKSLNASILMKKIGIEI
jgi:DNA mismatch repair ATPase MutS